MPQEKAESRKPPELKALLRRAVPPIAYALISSVGGTSRVRYLGLEHLLKVRKPGQGYIYAFWHQRQMIFTYTHRDLGAYVLVSRSKDGELIAETMRLSRIGAIRGSSSRGGAAAVLEMTDLLARGHPVGLTPDGPKGPARRVKPGILYLAQKSGAPILPITNGVSRRIELSKAWDRYHIPLPFSEIVVAYGPPIRVAPEDDLEKRAEELRLSLDRITGEADESAARACRC